MPFENSIEGSVRPTLDTLAFDAPAREADARLRGTARERQPSAWARFTKGSLACRAFQRALEKGGPYDFA